MAKDEKSPYGQAVCKRCGTKGLTWFEKQPGKWVLAKFDLDEFGNNIIHRAGGNPKNKGFYAHTVHTKKMCDWLQSDEYKKQTAEDQAQKAKKDAAHRATEDMLFEKLKASGDQEKMKKFRETSTYYQTEKAPETSETATPKPKGFTNKFPGKCVGCGTQVGTGEGVTSRGVGGWEVRCVGCHHG